MAEEGRGGKDGKGKEGRGSGKGREGREGGPERGEGVRMDVDDCKVFNSGHSLALMEFQEIRTVYLQKNLETILGSNPNMG